MVSGGQQEGAHIDPEPGHILGAMAVEMSRELRGVWGPLEEIHSTELRNI